MATEASIRKAADDALAARITALEAEVARHTFILTTPTVVTPPVVAKPIVSGISVSAITGTTCQISWFVDVPSTGQVAYGTTTGYGSLSTLESSLLTFHSQSITGLSAGTTYHFAVNVVNADGVANVPVDQTFESTPPATTYVGPINMASKNNHRIATGADCDMLSLRFRATQTSNITAVRVPFRGGSGYSAGTGGTYKVSIQSDDGTGKPTGTILGAANGGYATVSPGIPNLESRPLLTLGAVVAATAGTVYHVVFDNTHASEASNYVSVNAGFGPSGQSNPRQLVVTDDLAVLRHNGSTWTVQSRDVPTLEVTYSNATYDGLAYTQPQHGMNALITDTKWARQLMTFAGNITVTAVHVTLGRQSGTGLVTVSLKTGAGSLIEAVTTAATSFAVTGVSDDPSNGTRVRLPFLSSHVLTGGTQYSIEVKAAAGTQVNSDPVAYQYFDPGLTSFSSTAFREGTGQKSTNSGSSWATLGSVAPLHQFILECA